MLDFEKKFVPQFPDATMYAAIDGMYTYTILLEDGGYSATYKGWDPITDALWIAGSDKKLIPDYESAVKACDQVALLNRVRTFQS